MSIPGRPFLPALLWPLLCLPLIAAADEPRQGWRGSVEAGAVYTTGNTENASLDVRFKPVYQREKWEHRFFLSAYAASEAGKRTAERYLANYKARRDLEARDYLFANLRYEDDRFSGYAYQASQTVGYGRRLLEGERHRLSVEGGAGARESDPEDGPRETRLVGIFNVDYVWKVSKAATLKEGLVVIGGADNTEVQSLTDFKVRINHSLALVLGLDIKYNSRVPAGRRNTDTKTTVNIVYDF